ncbi:hypothetical protein EVAR_55256_1 [Eumeta japonica]|uniref:Uncharacterized protein n=1 Tax=Eumeta variegata TaxID=151549 RepID=A0A4C1Z5C1_EUMVA|nr:hypothetical protein EVAR_55256_1 [Eumeta japonica]
MPALWTSPFERGVADAANFHLTNLKSWLSSHHVNQHLCNLEPECQLFHTECRRLQLDDMMLYVLCYNQYDWHVELSCPHRAEQREARLHQLFAVNRCRAVTGTRSPMHRLAVQATVSWQKYCGLRLPQEWNANRRLHVEISTLAGAKKDLKKGSSQLLAMPGKRLERDAFNTHARTAENPQVDSH